MVRNRLHIMMASNEQWIVPAGPDARRYFVTDVSAARKDDRAYFKALMDSMDNGGSAAMLHDLLHHDLSNFDHRAVPQTAALAEQKIAAFKGPTAWLYEVLCQGDLGGVDGGDDDAIWDAGDWRVDGITVIKDLAYKLYCAYAKAHGERLAGSSQWARGTPVVGRYSQRLSAGRRRPQAAVDV